MKYSLLLDYQDGNGFISAGTIQELQVKVCVGALGKHQTQTATCTVRGHATILRLLALGSSDKALAEIRNTEDNTLLFAGMVKGKLSVKTSHAYVDVINLSIYDFSDDLKCYIYDASSTYSNTQGKRYIKAQTFTGLKICDPSDIDNSIVHQLFALAGYTDISCSATDTTVLPTFELEANKYLNTYIEALLYEYGLDYRFDGYTVLVMSTSITRQPTSKIVTEDIRRTLELSKSQSDSDGLVLTYTKFDTWTDFVLATISKPNYSVLEIGMGEANGMGWTTGFYYPHAAESYQFEGVLDDDAAQTTWDFSALDDYDGAEKISIANIYGAITDQGNAFQWTEAHVEDATDTDGKCYIKYGGWYDQLNRDDHITMKVLCDLYFKYTSKKQTAQVGDSPDTYTAIAIHDDSYAMEFVQTQSNRIAAAIFGCSFTSPNKLEPNEIVNLSEYKNIGFAMTVRVLSRYYDDSIKSYVYSVEGAGDAQITKDVSLVELEDNYPVTSVDFLVVKTSRDSIDSDETINESKTVISAYGTAFDKYNLTPVWKLNDVVITPDNSRGFILTRDDLQRGLNTITCTVTLDGSDIARGIKIIWGTAADTDVVTVKSSTSNEDVDDDLVEAQFGEDEKIALNDDDDIEAYESSGSGQYKWLVTKNADGTYTKVCLNPDTIEHQCYGIFDLTPAEMLATYGKMNPTDTSKSLLVGDSYVYHYVNDDDDDCYIPERWNGTGWAETVSTDTYYALVMEQCRASIISGGKNVKQSSAALYGWFGTLAAQDGIVNNLFTKNLDVGDGDGTSDSGFRTRIQQYDANGDKLDVPIFDVMYGDKVCFKIVPTSGRVFLGEPNDTLDAPASGFMYDPSDGAIHSVDDKTVINEDGTLKAVDFYASGDFLANNTPFKPIAAGNFGYSNSTLTTISLKNVASITRKGTGYYRITLTNSVKVKMHTSGDYHYIDVFVVANSADKWDNGFTNPILCNPNWLRNYIDGRLSTDGDYAILTYVDLYFIDNNTDNLEDPWTTQFFLFATETT